MKTDMNKHSTSVQQFADGVGPQWASLRRSGFKSAMITKQKLQELLRVMRNKFNQKIKKLLILIWKLMAEVLLLYKYRKKIRIHH